MATKRRLKPLGTVTEVGEGGETATRTISVEEPNRYLDAISLGLIGGAGGFQALQQTLDRRRLGENELFNREQEAATTRGRVNLEKFKAEKQLEAIVLRAAEQAQNQQELRTLGAGFDEKLQAQRLEAQKKLEEQREEGRKELERVKEELRRLRPDTNLSPTDLEYQAQNDPDSAKRAAAQQTLKAMQQREIEKQTAIGNRMAQMEELRQKNRVEMETLRQSNRLTNKQANEISSIDSAITTFDELEKLATDPENQELFQSFYRSPVKKLSIFLKERAGTLSQTQKDFVRFLNTNYAETRKRIAGVAVTPYEGKLAEAAFPNLELPSYGDFQAAVAAARFNQEKLKEAKLKQRTNAPEPKKSKFVRSSDGSIVEQ